MNNKIIYFLIIAFIATKELKAQQYTINGNASQEACNAYSLTQAIGNQSGSVWNNNKINLTQIFDFKFDVFLGNSDAGADGIVFVLQPISTVVGSSGGGLGYSGISPAVGVAIDTWQNTDNNDPFYDHIAIQLNGDLNHSTANNIAGPVTALSGSDNIEDGIWHSLRVQWNAPTKTMTVYMDGVLRVSAVKDFVTDVFSGNPLVYWGFTGSTGGANNWQRFKTALNPSFHFSPTQKKCVNTAIQFIDSTISFATIASFSWNFGDGSPVDNTNLNPVHIYSTPGDYTVVQTVTGADGCMAINSQLVRIGSKPNAAFTYNDSCINTTIQFADASNVNVGTINNWFWEFESSSIATIQNPTNSFPSNGMKLVRLAVKSQEGCESDTLSRFIRVYARPVADFNFTDSVCLGTPTLFFDNSTWVEGAISGWTWNFGDGSPLDNTQNPSHVFATAGLHTVQLSPTGINAGCGASIQKDVFVVNKPIAYFKANTACQFAPIQLLDSSYTSDGLPITNWWWDLGNGQFSNLQNPSVTYASTGPYVVRLVVNSSVGCPSDTISKTITLNAKPLAKFGYGNLLCSNKNVVFSDSSTIANGSIAQWNWLIGGSSFSSIQNPSTILSAGIYSIKLVTTSAAGCVSDTSTKLLQVFPKPDIAMLFSNACRYSTVNFIGTELNGLAMSNWQWSFGDGGTSLLNPAQHSYNQNGIFPVTLSGTSIAGCNSDTLNRAITIYSTQAFAGNDTIAAAGQPIQLNASGGVSYQWLPPVGLNDAFISNPIAVLNQTQQYILKAFTPQGCTTYDTVLIKIYKGPDIYIPNAFTPNGDGLNDLLRGIPVGIKEFKYFKIYNRWGQEIFATDNYRIGWNGEWKGQKQEQGVYIVIANGIDFKGNIVQKKVSVMLLR
ncbi:MAG: PKD domain-containing protein [Chitinophagaceae bacterium]